MDRGGCPSDEDLACHADGHGSAGVAAHVADCVACAGIVEAMRHAGSTTVTVTVGPDRVPAEVVDPAPGTMIDRYVLLRHLGRGGMGVVVLAYDPVLDRTVAVKLMRPELAAGKLAARLEREARSLARLAHPNVVRVFDAGTWHGQLFMAMEHIEGETLRTWLDKAPRSTGEILGVFVAAGRGLVATHDAGFIHRDVKPGNILLGNDGIARLADFGLVGHGTTEGANRESPPGGDATPPTTPDRAALTRPDTAMGTPGYMAPEQRGGGRVGAAADQFGFCASLWEALFDVRPAPDQAAEPEPPGDRRVPVWLREVLARGLRAAPETRWPTVRALLDAIEHDPVAARRRRLVRGGAGAAIVALGGLAAFGLSREAAAPDRRCRDLGADLAGVWDDTRAAKVEQAFLATGRSQAAATYRRVAAELDAYAGAWLDARVESCESTHVRGVQSEAVLDARMTCLHQRLHEVGALVDVLAGSVDAATLDRAVSAVARLAPVDECADTTSLQVIVPLPADPAARAEIDELRGAIADAKALELTGQYVRGLELARAAAVRAERIGYPPAHAEALHRRASLEDRTGDAGAAELTLADALVAAGTARDDALAAEIWADLVYIVGGPLARPADALRLRPGAEAALARAGGEPRAEARLWIALAMTHYVQGDLAGAREAQEKALVLLERALGSEHADLAPALTALGNFFFVLGAYDDARAVHARALGIFESTLGPEHPSVAASLTNIGLVLQAQGDLDEARTMHERALVVHERTLGPTHPVVAGTLTNLGLVLQEQGRHDEARRHHERALAIREQALGKDHPDVAVSLNNLGATAQAERRFEEADRLHRRALAIREQALGPDHPDVAVSHNNLGDAQAGLGDHRAALAHYGRALEVWRAALGPDHPYLAHALTGLARERLVLNDAKSASADAERALELRERTGASPGELAATRLLLARALWAAGRDRPRAVALAREVAAGALPAEADEASAWLATVGRR